ncbi:MAG: hypothetical protein COA58_07395 [Bacteroidetes bacterium]|nr:MAG: hypothetical protein COA58_07395 [Bacteroidota bacterium]
MWIFPSDGIPIGESSKLKFVSFSELQGGNDSLLTEVDIDQVLLGVSPEEEILLGTDSIKTADTSKLARETQSLDTLPAYRRIQLPPNNPNALKTLLYGLRNESKHKVVRILHYGDSQLEGDRITDYFRNRMQQKFGGKGPGILLPNEPAASSRRCIFVSESKNIKKSAIYVNGSKVDGNKFGIGGSTFEISGATNKFLKWDSIEVADSVKTVQKVQVATYSKAKQASAFIKLRIGYSGYALAKQHSKVTLLYQNDEYFDVNLRNDNYINDYTLKPSIGLGVRTWDLKTKKKLTLSFTKGKFPTIFGIALDGKTGVAVDNFAMRGSSAIGFDKMNRALYKRQLNQMNVRCIILQYGINVVPHVRSDYGYYKNILVRQLLSIKAAYPGISIIVIGPSDMSRNKGGRMVSYSNIPLIRDAMKEAALESGCCFWDLYEAMGGENSMLAWVNEGLGQKDYTHFSYKGAKYVGEMLYEAILDQLREK